MTEFEKMPVWLNEENACELLGIQSRTLKAKCQRNEFTYKVEKIGRKYNYFIKFSSLPKKFQKQYFNKDFILSEPCLTYSEAPDWAKIQAEKYISIIKETQDLKGKKLQTFIKEWNLNNPNFITSYSCLMKMKKRFEESGINGLLARYGHKDNYQIIEDKYFNYFKNLYLIEGSPSLYSCWEQTRGFALRNNSFPVSAFPSYMAFKRKLEKEVPKQSIYLARHGKAAWNKKYGNYIDRDYSNIVCGKVWVSDHAQIDVACLTNDGNVVFPWVTAWRDYKSGKWLGWLLQSGNPNSDHIFQTFYYAANEFGLPEDVIIDNGKDYRCKDFAGGRRIKISSAEAKTNSMLSELNVQVHFALPYNAQTKPIERDFLKIKELLSKHCIGYRGGNVVERPEKLAVEIKKGKIMPFDDFKKIFDDFIVNVLNKKPSRGKNLKGLSPNELFNQEFTEKITTSKDALKLFCMRTSQDFTVGRNGIQDRTLGITYWDDWMISKTGLKVYLRRDIQNYKEAWVFNAQNDEFIGKVAAVRAVAALHAEKVSKDEFKEAMSIKKRNLKVAQAYIKQTQEISIEEQCENYKAAYATIEKAKKPKVTKIANTPMDKAIRKSKEMDNFGKQDLSVFLNENNSKDEHLFLFATDKELQQEEKGVANGY